MDMAIEKFNKFSHMVMHEAEGKKKEIIELAEKAHQETVQTSEIEFLKKAYEHIQTAIRKIDKGINEEVSKAIVESKQALFNRRDEIMTSVFNHISEMLVSFKKKDEYRTFLEQQLKEGLSQVGQGELIVLVDGDDLVIMGEIAEKSGIQVKVKESDEYLIGGCIVINKTKGIMSDGSFMRRVNEERATFLENYGLSIE